MDDKALLDAIGQMLDAKLKPIEARLAKVEQQQAESARNTVILMDAQFTPQFKLLSEELDIIKERLPDPDLMEKMQDELDLHHDMLRMHTKEISALKKAN